MRPYTLGSHPVGTEAPPDQRLPLIRNTEKNGLARAGPFFHAARKRRQKHDRCLHSGMLAFLNYRRTMEVLRLSRFSETRE